MVNATEIVSTFVGENGMKEFRDWCYSKSIREDASEEVKNFDRSHRNIRKHWDLPEDFPSNAVVKAYLQPLVDHSTEVFEWALPDLENIRSMCCSR